MGPDLEMKVKVEATMDVPICKENKFLECANNCEDKMFDMEPFSLDQTMIPCETSQDREIDIIERRNNCDDFPVETVIREVTESSSSFGDTVSGTENCLLLDDEDEVKSGFCTGNALPYDGCCEAVRMRKKKLTVHWRKFIHPLMWRCKWIELRMKELQSRALEYDRELALYDLKKQSEYEIFMHEGLNVKSIPFSSQGQRSKAMGRKKRKRIEETADISAYMSKHNLFSYYDRDNSASTLDFCTNQVFADKDNVVNGDLGTNQGSSSFDFGDGYDSLELILSKIEAAEKKVKKLKNGIEKVMRENPTKVLPPNELRSLAPCDALVKSDKKPTARENGKRVPVKPETSYSSQEEVTPLPNKIKKTEQTGGYFKNCKDGILIHDQAAKEELLDFEKVRGQVIRQPQMLIEEKKPILLPPQFSEVDLPSQNIEPNLQQSKGKATFTPKFTSFPKNKRKKQGKRKIFSKR